jgi:hypothetical protein
MTPATIWRWWAEARDASDWNKALRLARLIQKMEDRRRENKRRRTCNLDGGPAIGAARSNDGILLDNVENFKEATMRKAPTYLIWESKTSWNVSRLDGVLDEHTRAAQSILNNQVDIKGAVRYFKRNGLSVEVYPLDDDLQKSKLCRDTWDYNKYSKEQANV